MNEKSHIFLNVDCEIFAILRIALVSSSSLVRVPLYGAVGAAEVLLEVATVGWIARHGLGWAVRLCGTFQEAAVRFRLVPSQGRAAHIHSPGPVAVQ